MQGIPVIHRQSLTMYTTVKALWTARGMGVAYTFQYLFTGEILGSKLYSIRRITYPQPVLFTGLMP